MADKCSSWHGYRNSSFSSRSIAKSIPRRERGYGTPLATRTILRLGVEESRCARWLQLNRQPVPAGWLAGWFRSQCQITNISENWRDRFPVQSKQAEHKVTNFADTASPCHRRAASSLDGREVSGRCNRRLNKLSWQFSRKRWFGAHYVFRFIFIRSIFMS